MIRVLHRLALPDTADERLADEAEVLRGLPGCLEAEAYRSLRVPEEVAVVHLWSDESALDAHVAALATGERRCLATEHAGQDGSVAEIYPHRYFAPVDGVWTATGRDATSRVVWPAGGPVRIVIQSCFEDPEAEAASLLANEEETLREPGCEEYGWFHGIGDHRHVLLLEHWRSQRLYDQHWNLRLRTGSTGAPRRRAERSHGRNGAEFYRRQPFRLLYDRWLPADEDTWSTTVDWSA